MTRTNMATSVFDINGQKLLRKDRAEGELLSRSKYNVVMGLVIAAGLGLNATMSILFPAAVLALLSRNLVVVFIGFLAMTIGSIYCIYKFDNPRISFIGFLVLSIAFGVLVSIAVHFVTGGTAIRAFAITATITLGMVGIASALPHVFEKMGSTLFAALVITLVAEAAIVLIAGDDPIGFDCIFAAIFALYIGYDWQKAQTYPPTLDNAIDSAADIYMDIIGLFLRLLSITGKKQ